jgi:anthranilate phosphoribosyltransferase
MIKESIQKLVEGKNLTHREAGQVMLAIMLEKVTISQMAALLTALRMKGETVEEITAFADVMRQLCCRIRPNVKGRLVDTCGTGGDRTKTFNVSTAAAFVIAGAGVPIAKHGNRAVTSRSGSADVLERLGFNLNMQPTDVRNAIEQVGIGFMFAPAFHPAMKHVAGTRRELGIRTVFNVLGPLTNPASATAQLLGVYDLKLTSVLANVLKNLGCEEAMVVYGMDGLDEISTLGKTSIARLRNGKVTTMETSPRDFGVQRAELRELEVATPDESAEVIFSVLSDRCDANDPKREIALVNASAGIIVGGKAEDFNQGMELARTSINSGAAYGKLKALVKASGGNSAKLEELESKYD